MYELKSRRWFMGLAAVAALTTLSSGALAQTLNSDAVLDSIASYLARQWGFPYTGFVGSGYVQIGHIYGYEQVSNFCEWRRQQRRGKKIEIGLFDDSVKFGPIAAIETQRYLVRDKLADFVTGSLSAELQEAGISAALFRDALKAAEIRFVVQRVSYAEASLLSTLAKLDLSKEIAVSTKSGFVSPFELLVVTDFSYKSGATSALASAGGLKWLSVAKATISKGQKTVSESEMSVPDFSVLSFKTVPFPPKKYRCK